jgi:UDP-glucose 4-epimerase
LSEVIVVTGAFGFMGRAVVTALAQRGVPVLAASRHPSSDKPASQSVILDSYAELRPTDRDDVLLHLGEPNDVGAAEQQGETYVRERLASLSKLLAKGWGSVVYASSAVVYGAASRRPHKTSDTLEPAGVYASAKLACEREVLARGGAVARIANVYGHGMARNNVFSDILRQIPCEGPLMVRNRKAVRDYLWIEDLAEALGTLASSGRGGVWNVGTGTGTSVLQLAQTALDLAQQADRPIVASTDCEFPSSIILDISETVRGLRWQPRIEIKNGLAKLLEVAA